MYVKIERGVGMSSSNINTSLKMNSSCNKERLPEAVFMRADSSQKLVS